MNNAAKMNQPATAVREPTPEDFSRKHENLNDAVKNLDGVIEHILELMNHIGIPRAESDDVECPEKSTEPTLLSSLCRTPVDIRSKILTMHDLLSTTCNELT